MREGDRQRHNDRRRRRGGEAGANDDEEEENETTHRLRGEVGLPRGGMGRRRGGGGGMTPPPAATPTGTMMGWETDRRRRLPRATGDYRNDRHHRCERDARQRGFGLEDIDSDGDSRRHRYRRDSRRRDDASDGGGYTPRTMDCRDDYSDDENYDENDLVVDDYRRHNDDTMGYVDRAGRTNHVINSMDVVRVRERPHRSSVSVDDVGMAGIDVGKSERHLPPLSTPTSHVAIDDRGLNNIDITVKDRPPRHESHRRQQQQQLQQKQQQQKRQQELQQHKGHTHQHQQQWTATSATFSAAVSAGGSLKKFLRRGGAGASCSSGTNASAISSYASTSHSRDRVVIVPSCPESWRRPLAPPTHVVPTSDVVNDVDLLAYWSSLSVKAAMAVMSAGGGEAIARRAANSVLEASENARKRKGDVGVGVGGVDQYLHDLATRVSLAILEEGGDHVAAAAASVAIMNEMGKKDVEKAKNDAVSCHATPFHNGSVGENGGMDDPCSVSSMMDENSMRVVETKKMDDKSKEEYGNMRVTNRCEVKNESQHIGGDEPSTRVDGNDQEEEIGGIARASKRLELQKMEEDIDRKRKELDDRLARLGTTTSLQTADGNRSVTTSMASRRRRLEADKAEILARSDAIDEMTARMIRSGRGDSVQERATESSNVGENEKVCQELDQQKKKKQQQQQQQQQQQVEAKEEALKEKEAQIAFKSEQLKEASRLNLEKEREIRERMSALDAAITAIIERAGNVQREIDHRMNVNVVDKSGRSGGMGQVDGINELRDKGLMPMPSQNGEIDANRSSSLEEQQREENANLEKGNNCGGITVATPDHSDAPVPAINVHLRQHQSHVHNDLTDFTLSPQQREQTPRPPQENFVMQFVGKICCIPLDEESCLSATFANSSMDGGSSRVTGTLFSVITDSLALTDMESVTLCDTLTGTISGMTDDKRLAIWLNSKHKNHSGKNNANQTSNQASMQPIQNVSISPGNLGLGRSDGLSEIHKNTYLSHLPNQGTNQRNGERNASSANQLKTHQLLNQGHRSPFNHNSSTASQSMKPSNRVTSQPRALIQAKNQRNRVRNEITSIIHGPSTTSQSMKHANRVTSQVKVGGRGQVRSDVRGKVRTLDQDQIRAENKENRAKSTKHQSNPPVKSPVTASLTKLKSGLFTHYGKKSAIKESDGGRTLTAKNNNNSTPSRSDSKGRLLVLSSARRKLFNAYQHQP